MTTQNISSSLYRGLKAPSFTATFVLPITKAVIDLLPAAPAAPHWLRRLTFQMALKRAYTSFANYYPQWTAALFDEHFLSHSAASLLAGYAQNGSLPPASDLALAWDQQLGSASPAVRQRRLAELTPVAADFLDWLILELATSSFL